MLKPHTLTTFVIVKFLLLVLVVHTSLAAPFDTMSSIQPKGTICYSNSLVVAGEANLIINCKGLGKFNSIAEIYDRSYRVVSSGFVPESRPGMPAFTSTIYMIIEERK